MAVAPTRLEPSQNLAKPLPAIPARTQGPPASEPDPIDGEKSIATQKPNLIKEILSRAAKEWLEKPIQKSKEFLTIAGIAIAVITGIVAFASRHSDITIPLLKCAFSMFSIWFLSRPRWRRFGYGFFVPFLFIMTFPVISAYYLSVRDWSDALLFFLITVFALLVMFLNTLHFCQGMFDRLLTVVERVAGSQNEFNLVIKDNSNIQREFNEAITSAFQKIVAEGDHNG